MKISRILSLAIVAAALVTPCRAENLESAGLTAVEIDDAFWVPKLRQWSSTTANDVLDKFESHNNRNTLDNFRNVAKGDRDSHNHVNLPWFDGLIYESIRGIADLMVLYPDKDLKMRVDSIVGLIAAAQATEPTGYINTYTQLTENGHRWGENGGLLRWMHDVYNAGMLIEAGVHYYNATGETKLLGVATRMANLMCDYMGPEPKHNLVPAHSGPEEAMVKLYRLYSSHPELADKTGVPARAGDYLKLAEFWIDQRGHHCGLPNWAPGATKTPSSGYETINMPTQRSTEITRAPLSARMPKIPFPLPDKRPSKAMPCAPPSISPVWRLPQKRTATANISNPPEGSGTI